MNINTAYEGLSKSFRTGRLEQEMQMVQLISFPKSRGSAG